MLKPSYYNEKKILQHSYFGLLALINYYTKPNEEKKRVGNYI